MHIYHTRSRGTGGGGEAESAATMIPSPQPGSQRGPAAESWNNTRPTRPRAARSDFCSSAGFSEAPGPAALPVISHVTEHQSKARDAALAPAEADLQTLAGNTITQPPRPSSPLRLREGAEAGCWCRRSGHRKGLKERGCTQRSSPASSSTILTRKVDETIHPCSL